MEGWEQHGNKYMRGGIVLEHRPKNIRKRRREKWFWGIEAPQLSMVGGAFQICGVAPSFEKAVERAEYAMIMYQLQGD